jgi:hypothetical protein
LRSLDDAQQALLQRYAEALRACDVDSLVALLRHRPAA